MAMVIFGDVAVEEFHRFYVLFYRVCQEGAVDWRGDCARLGPVGSFVCEHPWRMKQQIPPLRCGMEMPKCCGMEIPKHFP